MGVSESQAKTVCIERLTVDQQPGVFFNTLLLRFLSPMMAVGLAIMAEEENWGLLNNTALNSYVKLFLAVLLLDLIIYSQHVMFHTFPLLWRLHRMHHTDLDFDVATGSRFHPIEIILSYDY